MAKTTSIPCTSLPLPQTWLPAPDLLSTTVVLVVARPVRHGSPGRYLAGEFPDGIDGYNDYQDDYRCCPIHGFDFPAAYFGFGSRQALYNWNTQRPTAPEDCG